MTEQTENKAFSGLRSFAVGGVQGKPRVYFTCHPDDAAKYCRGIVKDLANAAACAVYYTEDMAEEIPADVYELDLLRMNLFVILVTKSLLTQPNRAMDKDFSFAKAHHLPVLPIMAEEGLYSIYSRPDKFGPLQSLDMSSKGDDTAVPLTEKLEKYLEDVLTDSKTADRVRDAFRSYIFLSYRKKDRALANELIRLIHSDEKNRDIAIWYDEYLSLGEDFSENIEKALDKSDLFALMVTPNITEAGNYVVTHEYPMARQAGKPVLPAEVKDTDRAELQQCFEDMPQIVDGRDARALSDGIAQILGPGADDAADDDPEHLYLMGIAYFDGIDTEVDRARGLQLISSAAEAGYWEAEKRMRNMYYNANGVQRDFTKQKFGEKDPEYLKAFTILGVCLNAAGDYRRCFEIRKNAAEAAENILGPQAPETLTAKSNLALTDISLGHYDQAAELAKAVYEARLQLLGEKHRDTLTVLGVWAAAIKEQGKPSAAAELFKKEWEGRRELFGDDHRDTLNVKVNYAVALKEAGQYEPAERLLTEASDAYIRLDGPEYTSSMRCLSELALVKEARGDIRNALEIENRAYDLKLRYLGPEHPQTLMSLSHVASLRSDTGDIKGALELYEKILDIEKRVLGSDQRSTLASMNNYALILADAGAVKKAAEVQQEVVDVCARRFGQEHPDTLSAMSAMAGIYSDLKDYRKAAEIAEKVLDASRRTLGEEHPSTLTTLGNLAFYYGKLGNNKRSVELKELAFLGTKKRLGPEHPTTLTQMSNLAFGYAKLGDHQKAADLQTQVFQLFRKVYGPEHSKTVRQLSQLAIYYNKLKDYKTAELLSREVYKIQCSTLGEMHRETLTTLYNIGFLLGQQGKRLRALKVMQDVYDSCRRAFGENDPDTVAAKKQADKLKLW